MGDPFFVYSLFRVIPKHLWQTLDSIYQFAVSDGLTSHRRVGKFRNFLEPVKPGTIGALEKTPFRLKRIANAESVRDICLASSRGR
jgi:hypothetical protein